MAIAIDIAVRIFMLEIRLLCARESQKAPRQAPGRLEKQSIGECCFKTAIPARGMRPIFAHADADKTTVFGQSFISFAANAPHRRMQRKLCISLCAETQHAISLCEKTGFVHHAGGKEGGALDSRLDRPFVELAYAPGGRIRSILLEGAFAALLAWWHRPAGWQAFGAAAACGLAAGLMDRQTMQAHWKAASRVTLREVLRLGREKTLPPDRTARKALPILAIVLAAAGLIVWSDRGSIAIGIGIPLFYAAFLLGRDTALAAAPPRGPR